VILSSSTFPSAECNDSVKALAEGFKSALDSSEDYHSMRDFVLAVGGGPSVANDRAGGTPNHRPNPEGDARMLNKERTTCI
jgi:hypothetical protein